LIEECTYTTVAEFKSDFQDALARLDEEHEDDLEYILLSNVTPKAFESHFRVVGEDDDDDESENPCGRWTAYDATLNLLLVQSPTSKVHGAASAQFTNTLVLAMDRVGMFDAIHARGAAAHHAPLGSKCADSAYTPLQLPLGRTPQWPSIVVEVAYADSASKLLSDVRFWDTVPPAGEVVLVVTIAAARDRPEIVLEKWGSNLDSDCAWLAKEQVVTIMKFGEVVSVEAGPMVFEFERVRLRLPVLATEERDVVLLEEDLKLFANHIWIEQGFVPWGQI
jgi:hypothetical protein